MLLPPDLEEMIPPDHVVRVVNRMIDQIDRDLLIRQYKGGGTSAYDPIMLLKIIVYGYTQRIFSSRRLAKALRENVNFMWLSGMNRPDHRTINRFRGTVMKQVVEEVFYQILEQLLEAGLINLKSYFVDGTKIESVANRYTYVWAKSTRRYKKDLQEKVRQLLDDIDEIEAEEEALYGEKDLEEVGEEAQIDSQKMKEAMERLNERLRKKLDDKGLNKAIRQLEKDFLPRMERYEQYEDILGERSSFSRTDPDATFMHMKEDHQGSGQVKPAYNVQIGTQNQFILGYSIHQTSGDTTCLIPHVEKFNARINTYPQMLIADAGYGSEENYNYLEQLGIAPYVKYNSFDEEEKGNYKEKKPYRAENFPYYPEVDEYECPQKRRLQYSETIERETKTGFTSERRLYICRDCTECPVKTECTRGEGNRTIQIGVELERLRQKARELLRSEQGLSLRSQRLIEAEAVFGRLKHNWSFRRFLMKRQENVKTEWGILSIAHNIAKVAAL